MCGILGKVHFDVISPEIDLNRFRSALNLMEHRGPDDSDSYHWNNIHFGHRRLSIIDLTEAGKQPKCSSDGNVVITFNGEIYNFRELRNSLLSKGYNFLTNTDTEVIIALYQVEGISGLSRIIGMFAFALHDKVKNTTYLVRDRLGVKPLFYYYSKNAITFSSEVKSILHLERLSPEINPKAISSYFSFRYPLFNETYFKNINACPPGHYIKIENHKYEVVKYWDAKDMFRLQKNIRNEEYYIETLKELLDSSVKYRMVSDVPLGAFLSGGVDSSIITALLAKHSNSPVKTFTIGFKESDYNELGFAKIVAEQFKTEHREVLVSASNYLENLDFLIGIKDGPLSVPNEVPLYLMSKALKEYITVVLSGEGADELFGGYGRIFRSVYDYDRMQDHSGLSSSLKQKFFAKYGVFRFENEVDHFISQYDYTGKIIKQNLLNKTYCDQTYDLEFYDLFNETFNMLSGDSYTNKMLYAFENLHLPGLLYRADTATMAASVEARVPFVDHRLVEFAFTVPEKLKLKWVSEMNRIDAKDLTSSEISETHDVPKYILKKAYEDIIPKNVLYRKKMGFPVPLSVWFGGNFNDYAKEILLDPKTIKYALFNSQAVEDLLSDADKMNQHSYGMKVWMMINVAIFFNKYF